MVKSKLYLIKRCQRMSNLHYSQNHPLSSFWRCFRFVCWVVQCLDMRQNVSVSSQILVTIIWKDKNFPKFFFVWEKVVKVLSCLYHGGFHQVWIDEYLAQNNIRTQKSCCFYCYLPGNFLLRKLTCIIWLLFSSPEGN